MEEYTPTDFEKTTVTEYVNSLGQNNPTPGGGSAAGVALSLAANAAAKAAVFSGVDENSAVKTFYTQCKKYSQLGLNDAYNDEKTFLEWKVARSLPKSTEQEKNIRTDAVNNAVVNCINVPYHLARVTAEFFKMLSDFIPLCNKWLLSDLLVANSLCYSSFCCAIYNIKINLGYLKDETLKSEILSYLENAPDTIKHLYESIIAEIAL